jgi:hypothetical protein
MLTPRPWNPVAKQFVLGTGVIARQRANEAIVGRSVVLAALNACPAEARGAWTEVTAMSWVSLDLIEVVQDEIARQSGLDPEQLHDQVIRRAVEDALLTVYRPLLRFASDAWLVSRAQAMFNRTRKIGKLAPEMLGPGRARLVLSQWPGITERYARQVSIGVERVLSLTGRKSVETQHELTADGARFFISWKS